MQTRSLILNKLLTLENVLEVLNLGMSHFLAGSNSRSDTDNLTESVVFRISDQLLFKSVLTEKIYERAIRGSLRDLFVFTFILRYRMAQLSFLAHTEVAKKTGADSILPWPFAEDGISKEAHYKSFENHNWWNSIQTKGYFPVFGFSALGCHVVFQQENLCRAFDFYDNPTCGKPAEDGLFCRAHRFEHWWIHPIAKPASVQAKMFAYYSNIHNLEEYDEEELEDLIKQFWKRLDGLHPELPPTEKQVDKALEYFGYKNRQHCKRESAAGLKRRFWSQAKLSHPDRGGSEEQFATLSTHYEILRALTR